MRDSLATRFPSHPCMSRTRRDRAPPGARTQAGHGWFPVRVRRLSMASHTRPCDPWAMSASPIPLPVSRVDRALAVLDHVRHPALTRELSRATGGFRSMRRRPALRERRRGSPSRGPRGVDPVAPRLPAAEPVHAQRHLVDGRTGHHHLVQPGGAARLRRRTRPQDRRAARRAPSPVAHRRRARPAGPHRPGPAAQRPARVVRPRTAAVSCRVAAPSQ